MGAWGRFLFWPQFCPPSLWERAFALSDQGRPGTFSFLTCHQGRGSHTYFTNGFWGSERFRDMPTFAWRVSGPRRTRVSLDMLVFLFVS